MRFLRFKIRWWRWFLFDDPRPLKKLYFGPSMREWLAREPKWRGK